MPVPGIKDDDDSAKQFFNTVGRFIAKAIVDERTVHFHISGLFWKMVMEGQRTLSLYDLKDLDSDYA